jgi:hypothetical protein
MKLHVGQLISAPFLPGVAEVKAFSPRAGYWKLEAVLQDDNRQYVSDLYNGWRRHNIHGLLQPTSDFSAGAIMVWTISAGAF